MTNALDKMNDALLLARDEVARAHNFALHRDGLATAARSIDDRMDDLIGEFCSMKRAMKRGEGLSSSDVEQMIDVALTLAIDAETFVDDDFDSRAAFAAFLVWPSTS